MLILNIILGVLILYIAWRVYVTKTNKNFTSRKSPPVVLGLPLLGCVHLLLNIPGNLVRLRKRLGSVFTVHILGMMFTVISTPEARKHFFTTSDQDGVNFLLGQDMLVGPFFPDRNIMREISAVPVITKALRGERKAQMSHRVQRVFRDYVLQEVWNLKDAASSSASSVEVNLFDTIYRSVFVTNTAIFSGMEIFRTKRQEVYNLFQSLDIDGVFKNPLKEFAKLFLPGMRNTRTADFEKFMVLHSDAIAQRQKDLMDGPTPPDEDDPIGDFRDALQDLIEMAGDEDAGYQVDSKLLCHYLYSFYFAAQTNSYVALSWVVLNYIHYISHDTELKQRFESEIAGMPISVYFNKEDVIERVNELNDYLCNKMPLVESVILETLRISFSSSSGFRKLTKPQSVDGKVIPAGNMIVNSLYITRDQFDEPEEFIADRFLNGQKGVVKDPFTFAPFGRGRHPCTGEKFVMLEIKAILGVLLQECNLEVVDKDIVRRCRQRAKYQAAGITRPSEPVMVRVSRKVKTE